MKAKIPTLYKLSLKTLASYCLTLCLSQAHSQPCKEDIYAVYGPFWSVSFYKEYIANFHENIERLTDCKLIVDFEHDFYEFINRLKNHHIDLTFIPSFYDEALYRFQLEPLLEARFDFNFYLLSLATSDIRRLKQLEGKTILSPGRFTQAHYILEEWLMSISFEISPNVVFSAGHDAVLIQLLKGRADAGVVSTGVFHRMPDTIKENFHIIKRDVTAISKTSLSVSKHLDVHIRQAISQSKHLIKLSQWQHAANPPKAEPYSDRFSKDLDSIEQLKQLERASSNKDNSP